MAKTKSEKRRHELARIRALSFEKLLGELTSFGDSDLIHSEEGLYQILTDELLLRYDKVLYERDSWHIAYAGLCRSINQQRRGHRHNNRTRRPN